MNTMIDEFSSYYRSNAYKKWQLTDITALDEEQLGCVQSYINRRLYLFEAKIGRGCSFTLFM